MKILQAHTFYDTYLEKFYKENPSLLNADYSRQIDAIIRDGFSGIHLIAPYMRELGYDSELIIANNRNSQLQWLKEQNAHIENNTEFYYCTLRQQIDKIKPDVLYLSDPITFDGKFIKTLNHKPGLIFGWRAADIPAGTDWSGFDVMLTGLSGIRELATKIGAAHSEYFIPGYPEWLSELNKELPEYDISFCGSWTVNQHKKRNFYITHLAEYASQNKSLNPGLFINDLKNNLPESVKLYNRGPKFGVEMHKVLMSSKIVIDSRGDIRYRGATDVDLAVNETVNMRIFEATGCGAFLLTEYHDNLHNLFEIGKEIETFRNEKELIEKIEYYLEHEAERKAIAKRGRQRCLTDYSMSARTKAFDKLIKKYSADAVNNSKYDGKNTEKYFMKAYELVNSKNHREAFQILNELKSCRVNIENIDLLRAICFISFNDLQSAKQALLEELNFYPQNSTAKELLNQLNLQSTLLYRDEEFSLIFNTIEPYTMLSQERLYSLYSLAKNVCQNDIPGNFVECGVARGGSSALLAYVMNKYSKRPRRLFSFDSFEGMPEPTEDDLHNKLSADDIGWGTGTCASTQAGLLEVAAKLHAEELIEPVKGYFNETLPEYKDRVGKIAFLHMDGDWYESTKTIFDNFFENVEKNGTIQIDDYGFWNGCKKAVHEFEKERQIKFHLNKIDDTGVWLSKNDISHNEQLNFVQPSYNAGLKLNLGCGSRFHKEWINVDFNSNSPDVIKYDLKQPLPFDDNSFEVIYSSHLLEHFPKNFAPRFLKDCNRILRPGGIIRVVVPDLEQIINNYKNLLELSLAGDKEAQSKYDWIMLEMYDQTVRNFSGGEMLKYWQRDEIPAKEFVLERMGSEAKAVINSVRDISNSNNGNNKELDPSEIGKFRVSGEIHQWMYDRYSLGKLLQETGFRDIRVLKADQSGINGFNDYCLDIEKDGKIRKPDSLFMEAIK